MNRGGARLADPQVSVPCGRGMLRGRCGGHAGLRRRTRVRVIRRLSLQSEPRGLSPARSPPRSSRRLGAPAVGGSRKSLHLGEGLQEILVLRYLTKVEKTRQVEHSAAAAGGYTGALSVPGWVAAGRGGGARNGAQPLRRVVLPPESHSDAGERNRAAPRWSLGVTAANQ